MTTLATLGLNLIAVCNSIENCCAAQVSRKSWFNALPVTLEKA